MPKLIVVKFRKSPWNINYSSFPPGELKGGGKFKPYTAKSGFTGYIFTGELSRVGSAGTLRQGVFYKHLIF